MCLSSAQQKRAYSPNVFLKGVNAAWAGATIDDCPFIPDDNDGWERSEWLAGFDEATAIRMPWTGQRTSRSDGSSCDGSSCDGSKLSTAALNCATSTCQRHRAVYGKYSAGYTRGTPHLLGLLRARPSLAENGFAIASHH
jgi:hypothetical protein